MPTVSLGPVREDTSQPSRVWTPQQSAVFEWVKSQATGPALNLIVNAVAGSGKTTVLVEACKHMRGDVAFMAFNKKIVETLSAKLAGSGAQARTFHSTGLEAWKRICSTAEVDGEKMYQGSAKDHARMASMKRLALLALLMACNWPAEPKRSRLICEWVQVPMKPLDSTWKHSNIDTTALPRVYIQSCKRALHSGWLEMPGPADTSASYRASGILTMPSLGLEVSGVVTLRWAPETQRTTTRPR